MGVRKGYENDTKDVMVVPGQERAGNPENPVPARVQAIGCGPGEGRREATLKNELARSIR